MIPMRSFLYPKLLLATGMITVLGALTCPPLFAAETPASKATQDQKTTAPDIRIIGELQQITTRYEDTLVHLARKYNVGFVAMRAANPGVDPWLPGSGTRITIPGQHLLPDAPHRGIVINLPEMRLYYYAPDSDVPASYPIGIGRSGLTTPVGTTTIARRVADPVWYPTERMRREDPTLPAQVLPGPENPMGTHAMYLGWPSYAIHGTDKPYSIGRRLSSGCIRMYPEDILTVFDHAPVGTPVTVVDQPVKTAWIGDKFYIEVHPTQEQTDILSHDTSTLPDYRMSESDMKIILKGVGADTESLDWVLVRKAVKERRGIPMVVADRSRKPRATSAIVHDELVEDTKKKSVSTNSPAKKKKQSLVEQVSGTPLPGTRHTLKHDRYN